MGVGADRHAGDSVLMSGQDAGVGDRVLGRQIPDTRRLVIASRDNPPTIGADHYTGDCLLMSGQCTGVGGRNFGREVLDPRFTDAPRNNPVATDSPSSAAYSFPFCSHRALDQQTAPQLNWSGQGQDPGDS